MPFTVVENTPGYLPENDEPARFLALEAAQDYAQGLAEEIMLAQEHYKSVTITRESPTLWRITSPEMVDRVVDIIEDDEAPEGMQACRDCGKHFPYTPDADYCPACVAANQRVADALDDGISREIAYGAYIEAAPTQEERERRQRQAHCYWTSA